MWLVLLSEAISRTSSRILPTAAFHHVNFMSQLKPHVRGRNNHQLPRQGMFRSPCITAAPMHGYLSSSSKSNEEDRKRVSSYDIDIDEEAEQRLSSSTEVGEGINGDSRIFSRYSNLVQQVGLDSLLTSTILEDMPHKRPVSPNDIFCNRELKLSAIDAIGFDMDYTLAQYQQPAFDNLAFEGAKRKLVDSLGYPAEVLDLQYDHNVRSFRKNFFL